MSQNQYSILAILGENPQREYHLHELGRMLGKPPGIFQRGINSLENQGLITSRRQGNMRLFKIDPAHPLFREMMALVRKSHGIEGLLRREMARIKTIKKALIYGSYAKNRMRADSDIDLLVIADETNAEDDLIDSLDKIEKSFDREINYKILSQNEFENKRNSRDPFLIEVLSDKHLFIKGEL